MSTKKIPKLLVMFDTSVLFTQVASDLVRHDVKRIIEENSNHSDLAIEWHLPEVVIGERRYQMLGKANELLPNMQKLEKLLGHKFGVGKDTLELHVDKAINSSIEECGFKIATIDKNEIDWNNLISRSVRRDPPFEANEKEKGFRDSIIAHSFLHLHKNSPATANVCRLALISNDPRLKQYVLELTIDSKNIRMLSSLDELESLINTLVSTIPEEFAVELAEKARKLFFEEENNKNFYNKENIGKKILEEHAKELSDTIIPGFLRSGGRWWIFSPIFIKKERQRIYWTTIIEVEFEIYHFDVDDTHQNRLASLAESLMPTPPNKGLSVGLLTSNVPPPPPPQGLLGIASPPKKVVDIKGKEKFEVYWSTNLSQAQNLTMPKLEKIQYLGNNLSEGEQ
ncbi:MAG: PIN domain-containing protein [Candidatus Sedimenticola sp. (ex Thyasira tokunagai)]